jgi:putative membrane protein
MQMRSIKEYLLISLKGIAMGAADVVPGVSGGTIAFITGIYEELINSIKSIRPASLKLILQGKWKEFWTTINGNFLLSLLTGIFISILSLARLLKYLLETYPVLVWSFFFGLIVASAIYVARYVGKWNAGTVITTIAGIGIAWYITLVTPAEANTTWWFIFVSGAIAICAMILPGISGSFILVLLGMYKFILDAVSSLNLPVILLFLAGAAIGIISFSNILSWFLRKYHDLTIGLLAGFMVGSLNKIWPWKNVTSTFVDRHGELRPLVEENVLPGTFERLTGNPSMLAGAVALSVAGFLLIFVIEGMTGPKKQKA